MTITELSIKRPTLVVVLFTVLGILGVFGYSQLKYELLPKISPPVVVITTVYPGASPQEVENGITKYIEDAVSSLDKVTAVRSTSAEGISVVTIELTQSAKVDIALQDAQRKVNAAQQLLPKDARTPVLSKIALDEIPVLRVGATSTMSNREFYQFLKDKIQPALSKVEGVGNITLLGGEEREIKVNVDIEKVRGYGLGLNQIAGMIKASNLDFPTGKIKDSDGQFIVRLAGKFSTIEQIEKIIIGRSKSGGDIKLKDIAEIEDGRKEFASISRLNGITTIAVLIQKQSDANSVDVSKKVREQMSALEQQYADTKLSFTIAQDGSLFTIEAANAVKFDLIIAIILVAAVMFIFLHSLRNSLIVMIAIPASLLTTIFAMYMLNYSFNLMTLLAMSLVIGILVDDSIVVLENIYRHLEMGKDKRTASIEGRNEIGFAALSITLVDVVVFVPLSVVGGLVGNIMREFAVVVFTSTLMSLLVSFTITPALASRLAKLEHLSSDSLMGRLALIFERFFDKLTLQYEHILEWALRKRLSRMTVIFGSLLAIIGGMALVPLGYIGAEFISQSDRGEFAVTVEMPPQYSVEETNYTALYIEELLRSFPETDRIFTSVGVSNEGLIGQNSNNAVEFNVTLKSAKERQRTTDEIGMLMKEKISTIPGAKVRVNPIGIFGTANQTPIQIVVNGTSFEEVYASASKLANVARSIKGAQDVRLSVDDGKPESRIEIDRDKLATFGLTIGEIGNSLQIALTGDNTAKYRDGSTEYDMRILLDEYDRSQTEKLLRLPFVNGRGQQVELQQFASIVPASGPTKLQRENRNTAITVFSQALGRPSGNIVADIQKGMEKEQLPPGVSISYLGDQKNMKESFISLGLALGAAILFVYLIMVALYDSYIYPFVVLFSIPVAFVGALLAMALTMKALGIFPILGIIMMIGLVAKNAILLVDRANQNRLDGLSIMDALLDSGRTRLRPILMTTVAMVLGMLPIAVSKSSGAEWKTGLAWAIIGGLTSSLLLTLVLVPVIYHMVESIKEKRAKKKADKTRISEALLHEGLTS
ncbi:MAG: efflux RND transporter permease subunit [Candidatus Kapaibacteriota bacterium]